MPRLSLPLMLGFYDELEKTSALNPLVGSGALMGTLGGAATGYLGYSKAKAEGASTGEALGRAGKAGLMGAAGGAALGAGVGALKPTWGKEMSNFAQRQVHGLTGWTPKEGLHSIDHGAGPAIKRRGEAHVAHLLNPEDPKLLAEFQNATKARDAAQKAEQMGITSLPGLVKSVKNHGVIPTLKAGAEEQLHGTSTMNKALMLGLPAVGVAQALHSSDSDDPTMGKGERVGHTIGNVVGSLAGGPLPLVGGALVGEATGRAGKLIGRGIDRLRGVKPGQPMSGAASTDLTNGQGTVGHEIEMSPRYSGTAMEGGSFG